MDSDGQHEPASVGEAVQLTDREDWTWWREAASRPLQDPGLSDRRTDGSTLANRLADKSSRVVWAPERLHERFHRAAPQPLPAGAPGGRQRLQILYELLAISHGSLQVKLH